MQVIVLIGILPFVLKTAEGEAKLVHLSEVLPASNETRYSSVKEVDSKFIYVQRYSEDGDFSLDVIAKGRIKDPPIQLRSPHPQRYDRFGAGVSSNDAFVVVSAPGLNYNMSRGMLFIFNISNSDFVLVQNISIRNSRIGSRVEISSRNMIFVESSNNYMHIFEFDEGTKQWAAAPSSIDQKCKTYFKTFVNRLIIVGGSEYGQCTGRTSVSFYNISSYIENGMNAIPLQTLWGFSDVRSVDLYGDTLVIGDKQQRRVLVYMSINDTFQLHQTITPSQQSLKDNSALLRTDNDEFGFKVSLRGNVMVVSAPMFSLNEEIHHAGKVYLYVRENGLWKEKYILRVSDPLPFDRFGYFFEIDAESVYISHNSYWYNQRPSYMFRYNETGGTGEWGSWGRWDPCSIKCVPGTQIRTRYCFPLQNNNKNTYCLGNTTYPTLLFTEKQSRACYVADNCTVFFKEPENFIYNAEYKTFKTIMILQDCQDRCAVDSECCRYTYLTSSFGYQPSQYECRLHKKSCKPQQIHKQSGIISAARVGHCQEKCKETRLASTESSVPTVPTTETSSNSSDDAGQDMPFVSKSSAEESKQSQVILISCIGGAVGVIIVITLCIMYKKRFFQQQGTSEATTTDQDNERQPLSGATSAL